MIKSEANHLTYFVDPITRAIRIGFVAMIEEHDLPHGGVLKYATIVPMKNWDPKHPESISYDGTEIITISLRDLYFDIAYRRQQILKRITT